jgi:hypothetical protein
MSENRKTPMSMAVAGAGFLAMTTCLLAGRVAAASDERGNPNLESRAPFRTWTDNTGKHRLEAALVEVRDGNVRMRTASGGLKVIALDRLSAADQDYVRQQTAQPQPGNATAVAGAEFAWLSAEKIPNERISQGLNDLWKLSPEAAEGKIPLIQSTAAAASPQGRAVGALLVVVAQERAGKREAAAGGYRQLAGDAKGTPYSASASFRLPLLDPNTGEDAAYQSLARQAPEDGWYLTPANGWSWGDSRKVALAELLRVRSDGVSVRFFEWLRGYSPFPEPYAYMFILLAIGVGSTVLTLPWLIKLAGAGERFRAIAPQMVVLKELYSDDPPTYFKELRDLYQRHGISLTAGCLVGIVQVAFTIWVLVAMRTYWPRMILDGSQFLWVSDIARFDVGVVVLTAAAFIILPYLTGQTRDQASVSGQPVAAFVIGGALWFAIVGALARYWEWPAYVFIFFLLQQVLCTVTQTTFGAIRRLTR